MISARSRFEAGEEIQASNSVELRNEDVHAEHVVNSGWDTFACEAMHECPYFKSSSRFFHDQLDALAVALAEKDMSKFVPILDVLMDARGALRVAQNGGRALGPT